MTRIFISYAAEDRRDAERLAQALTESGFAVWWDRKIPLGRSFDQVIEENLARADCVLVLWTASSVQSRWVRAEASDAAAREVLIPVLLEPELRIPLEFRLLQAANLSDWSGDTQHAEFCALLAHIQATGERGAAVAPEHSDAAHERAAAAAQIPAAQRPAVSRRKARGLAFAAALIAPGVAILAAGIAAAIWRVPTRLEMELVIDRIAFTLAADRPVDMPARPLGFRTLSVENVDRVSFTPERVRWIDPTPQGARMLRRATTVVLSGAKDGTPALVLEGAGRGTGPAYAGRLQPLAIAPGSRVIVTASRDAPDRIGLQIQGQSLDTNVLPAAELALTATDMAIDEPAPATSTPAPLTLAFSLPEDRPFVQLQGHRPSFAITATLGRASALSLLDRASVRAVELLKQAADGAVESAIAGEGEIRYPQQPRIAPMRVAARDFVTLKEAGRAAVTRLELSPGRPGLLLLLDGVASAAVLTSSEVERDLRLTALQRVWHESRAVALLLAGACLGSLLAGGHRLYRSVTSA